jgi:aryl carrier-like protein
MPLALQSTQDEQLRRRIATGGDVAGARHQRGRTPKLQLPVASQDADSERDEEDLVLSGLDRLAKLQHQFLQLACREVAAEHGELHVLAHTPCLVPSRRWE